MDDDERKFREIHGDELIEKILLHTSQVYDYAFWTKEQIACRERPDIAYEVAQGELPSQWSSGGMITENGD